MSESSDSQSDIAHEVVETPSAPVLTDEDRSGVLYISDVPIGVSRENILHIFGSFGTINRKHFNLRPNTRLLKECWLEFTDKRCSLTASRLSGSPSPSGGLWTCQHLSKIKWRHVEKELNADKLAREQRLREANAVQRQIADFTDRNRRIARGVKAKQARGKTQEIKVRKVGQNAPKAMKQ